jgi:hypothetical protein
MIGDSLSGFLFVTPVGDRLCDLVFRVPGYRSEDPGFDSRLCQIF